TDPRPRLKINFRVPMEAYRHHSGAGVPAIADLASLTKPRITLSVLLTTLGGMWLAPHRPKTIEVFVVLMTTTVLVGAGNALNCWIERETDRRMARTACRPLP